MELKCIHYYRLKASSSSFALLPHSLFDSTTQKSMTDNINITTNSDSRTLSLSEDALILSSNYKNHNLLSKAMERRKRGTLE